MAERGPATSGDEFPTTTPPGGSEAAAAVVDQVQEVAGQVQEQAGRLVDQARQQLTTQVTSQKDRAAGGLETAAGLLRGAGEQLRALDQPTVAQYVDGAAHQAERFSEQLRTQDASQLVEATERFARRQPMLFVGTALTAGFLVTRFLRSSGRQQGAETEASPGAAAGMFPYGTDFSAADDAGGRSGEALGSGAMAEPGSAVGLSEAMQEARLSGTPLTPADYVPGPEER